jgi:hypothetical protein
MAQKHVVKLAIKNNFLEVIAYLISPLNKWEKGTYNSL